MRHQLLPLLQQFNPEAVRILAQTARLLQDDEDFIESCLPRAEAEEQTLSCSQLLRSRRPFKHECCAAGLLP